MNKDIRTLRGAKVGRVAEANAYRKMFHGFDVFFGGFGRVAGRIVESEPSEESARY